MKLGIVTPSYNSVRYIRETLDSVLSQAGDFELNYHVQDGGSSDGTVEILREFERRVELGEFSSIRKTTHFTWSSEPDRGMYDAISTGFTRVDGDVLAWLNADDIYCPGALAKVATIFKRLPEVQWLKGITGYINENSKVTARGRCYLYDRDWIRAGVYGLEAHFIQQDSVFWRRTLWTNVGGLDRNLRLAGDFSLWMRFARETELYSFPFETSCFRKVHGQLSQDSVGYETEARSTLSPDRDSFRSVWLFFRIAKRLPDACAQYLYGLFRRSPVGVILFSGEEPKIHRVNAFSIQVPGITS